MHKERRQHCDPQCLQQFKDIRLVNYAGLGYVIAVLAGGAALIMMIWASLRKGALDGSTVGYAGVYFNIVEKAWSHLSPSPLSNSSSQRRGTDSMPAGTVSDPLNTQTTVVNPPDQPIPTTDTPAADGQTTVEEQG